MDKKKICSICTENISFNRELQNFQCKNCHQSNDKLMCKVCINKLTKCPFCNGEKCDEVRVDIHRTAIGSVQNVIVARRKKCIEKVIDKLFKSDNDIIYRDEYNENEDDDTISCCECLMMLNIKNIFISIWVIVVLFMFGYYGCNKNNNDCHVCIICGILTPICIISYVIKMLSDMNNKTNLVFSIIWAFIATIITVMTISINHNCMIVNLKILYISIPLYLMFLCCISNTSIVCCN